MAKKINKRAWKKEAKRNELERNHSFAIHAFHRFCEFVRSLPDDYCTDPEFPETQEEYRQALKMFIDEEMPELENRSNTPEGRRNAAAFEYISEEIDFVGNRECVTITDADGNEIKNAPSFLEMMKAMRYTPFLPQILSI